MWDSTSSAPPPPSVCHPVGMPGGWQRLARLGRLLAGTLAILGSLLPAVAAPVPFQYLQTQAVGSACGLVALMTGVALLASAVVPAAGSLTDRRPWLAVSAAVVLAASAWLCATDVREALAKDLPGIGVHPGRRGPGVPVLWTAAATAVIAAIATVKARARQTPRHRIP